MKKSSFILVIIILVFFVVFVVFDDKNKADTDTNTESNTSSEEMSVSNQTYTSSEDKVYKIEFDYPVFGGESSVAKKINSEIENFTKNYISEVEKDYEEIIKESSKEMADSLTLFGKYELSRNESFGVINIMYEIYNYSGGAHGITNVSYIVFDIETGEKISLSDVFLSQKDTLLKLSDLSISEIKRIDPELETYNQVEEGASPKIENFQNFALDPAGFKIKFSDYQIGPYVAGRLEIILPYDSLTDLLKERFKK